MRTNITIETEDILGFIRSLLAWKGMRPKGEFTFDLATGCISVECEACEFPEVCAVCGKPARSEMSQTPVRSPVEPVTAAVSPVEDEEAGAGLASIVAQSKSLEKRLKAQKKAPPTLMAGESFEYPGTHQRSEEE